MFVFQLEICLNQKCTKVIGTSSDIFGNVRKFSENRWKSSEVAGMFFGNPGQDEMKISRI